MTISTGFSVIPVYAAILGLMFFVFTLRVGLYRFKSRVSLGDAGDKTLRKRIRGQGNFVETVPLVLLLLVLMESAGASNTWLHSLGAMLVLGRLSHYLQITDMVKPLFFRMGGMLATLIPALVASIWLLKDYLA